MADKIHLNLNKKLYSEQAIAISMANFKEVCSIQKQDGGDKTTLVFDCDDPEVVLEFSNYVLSLEHNKRGKT